MEDNSNSIYKLITKLSEKFANRLSGSQHKNVRRLRRKCYEILLSKSQTEIEAPKGWLLAHCFVHKKKLLTFQHVLKTAKTRFVIF